MRYQRFYLFLFTSLLFYMLSCTPSHSDETVDTVQSKQSFNESWQFIRDIDTTVTDRFFNFDAEPGGEWEQVALPHTAHIEPLVIKDQQWQGTAFYRKAFTVDQSQQGDYIALKFGAAMHEANIWLNGEKIGKHKGGYLPFTVDISNLVNFGEQNVVLVKLNNEDNPTIPPGKPINRLDFNYFSGLYRNSWLITKDKLRISDPIAADRTAAGGVRVNYEEVTNESAQVYVQTDLQNDDAEASDARVEVHLQDADGNIVAQTSSPAVAVAPNASKLVKQQLSVEKPELWSPDHPYLYSLTVQLYNNNDELIDSYQDKIGIRTFTIDPEKGLVLNGEQVYLRGTNRHQSYPYIGYALSENAQYRDAYKIKEAGFNFIRTAHYPPSSAFLDACDELGILFMNAIPGWQFFGGEEFQDISLQNVEDMIRRDRNHPSIIIWEASLNESGMDSAFMDSAHTIVHQELPFENIYSSGWRDYAYDIFIPARQHAEPPQYWNNYDKDKPFLIAEYGDWEYYAQNAGFNQDDYEDLQEEARNSRQLRGDGQVRLAQQALNFQEAHNSNLKGHAIGDANWVMYDYNRGYAPNLEASGIMDIFRIPKFTYYFYQSQAGPDLSADAKFNRPMVYISNFWHDPAYTRARVYSNTDEVALYLNGELIERRSPDTTRVSSHLKHPPFIFELETFEPGTLRAVGFIDGEQVAEHTQTTPGEAAQIELEVDYSGKKLQSGVKDVVFVYASVTDENGTLVPNAGHPVTFSVEGDGELIGNNSIEAEAGIATILLRAGEKAGSLTVQASADGLQEDEINIQVQ